MIVIMQYIFYINFSPFLTNVNKAITTIIMRTDVGNLAVNPPSAGVQTVSCHLTSMTLTKHSASSVHRTM